MTDAVRLLLSARGFEAVTVAAVARTCGVSVGLVQHYFPTKDDLLVSTHQATLDAVDERVTTLVADAERRHEPIRSILSAALVEYLPVDARRRTDHAVRLALLVRGATGPTARAIAAEHQRLLRARIETATRNGIGCGEVAPTTHPARAGHELVAVVLGLSDQLFVHDGGEEFAAECVAVLEVAVARVFAHPCQRHRVS